VGRGGADLEACSEDDEVGWRQDDFDLVGRFDIWLKGSGVGTLALGCRDDDLEV
jgi:hypothetical protein